MPLLTYSDAFLNHDTGPGHPERPQRLRAIKDALQASGLWDKFTHIPFAQADLSIPALIHDIDYLHAAQKACQEGQLSHLDNDTPISRESFNLALLATGGVIASIDNILQGKDLTALCLHRPPGHHAEFDRAMGFCIINHIAVAAAYLTQQKGLTRVAIVDFDVHHGNGTQHLFESRSDVLFISIHQDPTRFYPGTGFAREIGKGPGTGFTLNIPMPPGSSDLQYEQAFIEKIIPALDAYKPQFLLLSAGFDAADGDPLASMRISPDGFAMMTRHLKAAAQRHCQGKLLSALEGGYNLKTLASSLTAHATQLLNP
jgi:acetoin utilization deacetylase AcuC-like enzyme